MRKRILVLQDQVWFVFFSFVTFLWVLFFILKSFVFFKNGFERPKQEDLTEKVYKVFVEDSVKEKNEDQEAFLSRKNQKSSGALTKEEKGFFSDFNSRLLRIQPDQIEQITEKLESQKSTDSFFEIDLIDEETIFSKKEKQNTKNQKLKSSNKKIPFYYQEQKSFTFNFGSSKKLQLPTTAFKHYEYFTKMFDKIQEHWSPPGGRPYPVFGNEYHRSVPVPGRFGYRTFSPQNILLTFVLDDSGYVIKAKIYWSEGFEILDDSILNAILRANFFGVPSKELLEEGYLVVPVNFRIK